MIGKVGVGAKLLQLFGINSERGRRDEGGGGKGNEDEDERSRCKPHIAEVVDG